MKQLKSPEYPTYLQCVYAGKREATYRRNRTTKVILPASRK